MPLDRSRTEMQVRVSPPERAMRASIGNAVSRSTIQSPARPNRAPAPPGPGAPPRPPAVEPPPQEARVERIAGTRRVHGLDRHRPDTDDRAVGPTGKRSLRAELDGDDRPAVGPPDRAHR